MSDQRAKEIDVQWAESLAPGSAESAPQAVEWQPFELGSLWTALCSGHWRFKEVFDSESRCYAVIARVMPADVRPLAHRSVNVLSRLLLGESHKVVAFDLGVAPSTIAATAQGGLRSMGLKGQGSRAPILLAMAACAALRPRRRPVLARFAASESDDGESLLLSMSRPDVHFPAHLSTGEAAVLRQLIGGATYAEIARRRATSCRTVANQVANAFRKLGVSGRVALTAHLILLAPEFREGRANESAHDTRAIRYWGLDGAPSSNGFSQSMIRGAVDRGRRGDGVGGASLTPPSMI